MFYSRSITYFQLIFVKDIKSVAYGCPVVLAPFVEGESLFHCIIFAPLSEINLTIWESIPEIFILFR